MTNGIELKRLTNILLFKRLFLQQGQTFLEQKTENRLSPSGNEDQSELKQLQTGNIRQ